MKTMTCKQLGGSCNHEFHADTFDDLANQSRKHGMEMIQKGDPEHMKAMQQMQDLMKDPQSMQEWMEARKREFEALPES